MWDGRHDLPLAPILNNPWIYSAYAALCMRLKDGGMFNRARVLAHFVACENGVQNPRQYDLGCFARWPDGSGGMTSHDEIMGAAFHDPWIALRILGHLDRTGGVMNNTGELPSDPLGLQWNVYRMIFLRPYLLACAEYDVNIFDQFLWCVSLIASFATSPKGDAGTRLRNWLMADKMKRYKLCRAVIQVWCTRIGMSPKECLAIEPGEYPVMSEIAPDSWAAILADR